MKRLVQTKVNAAAALLVAAERLRSRRAVYPGDTVRYHYYQADKDGGSRLVQGTGTVELVRSKEPSVLVEGHPRWLFRREVAISAKKAA